MPRAFSLAYLTAYPLLPPEAIDLAVDLGYRHVGLRLLPVMPGGDHAPLISDPAMLRQTLERIGATGVGVFDIEIVRLTPEFHLETVLPFLETGARLGARAVLVAGDDPDFPRLVTNFRTVSDAAARHGLTADLEFMPWTSVNNARMARRVIEAAGSPNGRILIDAIHVARSDTTIADLAALPASRLSYAQICDAPAEHPGSLEGVLHAARQERLLPGEGGLPLRDIFAALPRDLPVSVEIPHRHLKAELGIREWARRALAASRKLVDAGSDSCGQHSGGRDIPNVPSETHPGDTETENKPLIH